MESSDEQFRAKWAKLIELAKPRAAMFIGPQDKAHMYPILDSIRLGWQAKVFRRPESVQVDLSPCRLVMRLNSGPLIRPVQKATQWGVGHTLDETWREDFRREESEWWSRKSAAFEQRRYTNSWRYCFCGPTGPPLAAVSHAAILAVRFSWGILTDEGLWCERYESGWPVGRPRLIRGQRGCGIVVAAELDPTYFTGIPMDEAYAEKLRGIAGTRFGTSEPHWTAPREIEVRWWPTDEELASHVADYEALSWINTFGDPVSGRQADPFW